MLCSWSWYGGDGFVVDVVVIVVVIVVRLMHVSIHVTTARSCITYNYVHVDARQGEPAGVVGGGVRHVGCDVAVIRSALEGSQPKKTRKASWYVQTKIEIGDCTGYEDTAWMISFQVV